MATSDTAPSPLAAAVCETVTDGCEAMLVSVPAACFVWVVNVYVPAVAGAVTAPLPLPPYVRSKPLLFLGAENVIVIR